MAEEQLRVLLVDDEWSLREPLAKRLRVTHDYHVDTAADAGEALRLVTEAKQPYDVALIDDLLTPEPDAEPDPIGIELMGRIRKHCSETECIIFTGWGMDRALAALRAGAYRYLAKPLNLDELGMTIRMAAEQVRLRWERDLLSATLEISKAMLRELDVGKTLKVIAEAVPKLIGTEACTVAWTDPATGQLRYGPMILIGDVTVRWHQHLKGVSLTRRIIETGQAFSLPDVNARADEVDENLRRAGVKSFVGVPIPGEPENWGVLYAYSTRREVFGTHEQRILQLLAGQAAIALDNARLFEEANRRAFNLETLQNLVLTINSSLQLGETLKAVCQAATEFFRADHSGLVLFGPDCTEGKVEAEYPISGTLGTTIPLRGVPAEEQLIETQQPLIIPNVVSDRSLGPVRDILLGFDIQSMLIMPVVGRGGNLLGSFSLDAVGHTWKFAAEEVELCKVFAAQVAVAIENARLHESIERQAKRLTVLYEIGREMAAALELDRILGSIAEHIVNLVGARRSLFLLVDTKRDRLIKTTGHGYPPEHLQRLTFEEVQAGVSGWVLRTGKPALIADARSDPRNTGIALEVARQFDTAPLIVVPLVIKGEVIGTLTGVNAVGDPPFTEDDRDMVVMLANQAAIAITNAQYFEEIQAGLKQFHSLYEASSAIISTMDPKRVLEVVVEEARRALGGWRAKIVLISGERRPTDLISVGFEDGLDTGVLVREDGISVQVMTSGKLWHTEDVQQIPEVVNPAMLADGVGAAACVPFGLRGHNIGVMWLHYKEPRRFLPSEIEALRLYANQAAIAYDNARQMWELEHLRRAVEKLASVSDVQNVLQQIVISAKEVLTGDSAVIWSYDYVRRVFLPDELVADGIEPELVERFREDEPQPGGTAETVMRQGYLAVTDISAPEYAFLGPAARGLRGEIGARAFQGIALRAEKETLGVLYVNYKEPRSFSNEDRATLETFAYHAALALKKARLMQQMERTKKAAEVVAGVTVQEDLQTTLDTIVQHVRQVLQSDGVSLYSYDETKSQLGPWATAIVEQRDPDSVGSPDRLSPESAVWTILRLDEPPYYHLAEDGAINDPLFQGKFVHKEGIRAAFGIQLRARKRKVGVMFVNYRSFHRFPSDEIATIELFANQAAVAIRNAQLYEETTRRTNALQTLYEASRAMTSTLALDETLSRIAEQAWKLIARCGTLPRFSHLALAEGNKLRFRAAYPLEQLAGLQRGVGIVDLEHDKYIGVTGRAVKTGQSQLVDDVTQDSAYIQYDPETRSELAVPIKLGKRIIGVINVEHPDLNAFDEEDQQALESLAAQAAVAIENARLYEEQQQRANQLALINQIAAGISSSLDLDKILQTLVNELARAIGVEQCAIALFDEKGEYGDVVAEFLEEGCVPSIGMRIPLRANATVDLIRKTKRPLAVKDAQHDPLMEKVWHIMKQRRTQSIMIVPIVIGDKVIGTIGLDAVSGFREFTKEEEWLAETIAHHAAIAIQSARRYEELKRTKGLVGARTALAWMGMANSTWRHSIEGYAINIRNAVTLSRQELQATPISPTGQQSIASKLDLIERLAIQILDKPITPPLSSEEGVEVVMVNDLISERIDQLWENESYQIVIPHLDLKPEANVGVRVSPEWLRRALDLLIDNAIESMANSAVRQLEITTGLVKGCVEIAIKDTGKGIPPEVYPKLFKERIEQPEGGEGMGMGLLMVEAIVQAYDGDVRVQDTGPNGTTMVISLPMEQ